MKNGEITQSLLGKSHTIEYRCEDCEWAVSTDGRTERECLRLSLDHVSEAGHAVESAVVDE
ncbi:hypothetical protein [Halegenticoccus tardaugens]|uniref:hypothetical protein n=1 Tax=Halegenticoccus tardaugens TaxID=2071624 RepID=UPI00100B990A|nr:hypothetical protein [Halegenticoccus tardaugens]